jgi:vesicle coat complex subunit
MTRGKDVSILFADIIKNMNTTDLEFKKLIYLYIINYSKSQPDLVILGINSLRKVKTTFCFFVLFFNFYFLFLIYFF